MTIKGYRVWPLLKKTGQEILDDNVLGMAAQMAYFFFFSLFPLLLFVAPMLALVGDKQQMFDWIMEQLSRTVPEQAMELVRGVVADVVFEPNAPGLVSIGAILALWTGSNVFNNMIDGLNRAYDLAEGRPFWKRRLLSMACVIVAGIVIITSTTIMLAGENIVRFVANSVGMGTRAEMLWMVAQYPVALSLLTGLAFLIYYFLPNLRGQSKWHVLTGAVIATLLWGLVTLAFRFYVQNFGNFSRTYGTIGGVIILLLWMYISMIVFLAVGELISELHQGTGHVKGRAGATYTGRIAVGDGGPRASTERIERVEPMAAREP